jgi:hypothetical protein
VAAMGCLDFGIDVIAIKNIFEEQVYEKNIRLQ